MKADLHVHTTYSSDGRTTPEEVVEAAIENGVGCVAITDHNSFKAYYDVKDNGKVIIVPGQEVSSKEGHIIALGIDKEIARGMDIIDSIKAIHEAGGIAVAAHPYRWWSGLGEKNVMESFDGVEALNGRSTEGSNRKSLALSKKFGKIITAGSDSHTPMTIGDGYLEIPDDCKTWHDVIDALKQGRCVPHSINRTKKATLKYGWKAITEWIFRGFRKM
jgi:predicted metal-dependent phosphoesterase TrpH